MVLGKLDGHRQENETRPRSYSTHRNNSKWIKGLNVKPETISSLKRPQAVSLPLAVATFCSSVSSGRENKSKTKVLGDGGFLFDNKMGEYIL